MSGECHQESGQVFCWEPPQGTGADGNRRRQNIHSNHCGLPFIEIRKNEPYLVPCGYKRSGRTGRAWVPCLYSQWWPTLFFTALRCPQAEKFLHTKRYPDLHLHHSENVLHPEGRRTGRIYRGKILCGVCYGREQGSQRGGVQREISAGVLWLHYRGWMPPLHL